MVHRLRWTLVLVALAIASLSGSSKAERAPAETTRALPAPERDGGPALATVLQNRRSNRTYAARDLTDRELSQLLWAAQGSTGGFHRTAPSAGALYPLTVHVFDRRGVWRYDHRAHALVREVAGDRRSALAGYGAPTRLLITADFSITARKYGARAERYATLEAGHVAQNVLLAATALGLHAVPIGAIDYRKVRQAVGVSERDTPLYEIEIGAPPRR